MKYIIIVNIVDWDFIFMNKEYISDYVKDYIFVYYLPHTIVSNIAKHHTYIQSLYYMQCVCIYRVIYYVSISV